MGSCAELLQLGGSVHQSGTSGVDGILSETGSPLMVLSHVLQHAISAYVAEACGGFDLQLHVCLFSVTKGTDPTGIIPARYTNPMETANAFKEIVQAAKGRFHWFGEAGMNTGKSAHTYFSLLK